MAELNPKNMLKEYRRSSSLDQNEEANLFMKLPLVEKLELLFYMNVHCVAVVQHLHGLISPDDAQTTPMPDEPKGN